MAAPPGILEVRCAGCGETLEVEHGLTEFACPDCGMAQSLPPELMPPRPRRALPLPGRVAPYAAPPAPVAPAIVTCGGCGSVLSVPHGPGRFACPLCGAQLASSLVAATPVVTTPAAVPISSTRLLNHRQVLLAFVCFQGFHCHALLLRLVPLGNADMVIVARMLTCEVKLA
jgi:predicted RNA-binding Zn-ribbon protein involved in translation (DUF1610 family)